MQSGTSALKAAVARPALKLWELNSTADFSFNSLPNCEQDSFLVSQSLGVWPATIGWKRNDWLSSGILAIAKYCSNILIRQVTDFSLAMITSSPWCSWSVLLLGIKTIICSLISHGQMLDIRYFIMYHFHTSDQRIQPVHISHFALVLEC